MRKKLNILPNINFDFSFGSDLVAGIDEAGRGPWAGPVVSAIVTIEATDNIPKGINDSKKLSPKKREYLYDLIVDSFEFAVGIIDVETIDQIGVGKATKLSMIQAFEKLCNKPRLVLIDGRDSLKLPVNTVNIIKGDTKSIAIASASIVAKVTRDRIMQELAIIYPDYLWNKNAGYGTKQHLDSIANLGITPFHRKSFKPIRNFLLNQN